MVDPDTCEHNDFDEKTHKCVACGIPCEHWEGYEQGQCVICGDIDDREPPDYEPELDDMNVAHDDAEEKLLNEKETPDA
jgi:hypothetical protein